jgi:PAS domain S-box-containing protein
VLIVEDSEDDAELILRELRRGGYLPHWLRVDTQEDMGAALDREPWDVVIADFKMPGFTGLAALRLLRERRIDVPFILASGVIGEEVAVEAMRAGANDYVMKRNLARLLPAIARELREAEERRRRRDAEEALQRQLQLTHALSGSIGEGVCTIDPRGVVTFANPAAQRLLGRSESELLGRDLHELGHPHRGASCPILDAVHARASYHSDDDQLRRKDGSLVPVSLTASPLSGNMKGGVFAFQDISERKQRIEADQFLARASESLAEGLDFDELLVRVARLCVPELADVCTVIVAEENGGCASATAGLPGEEPHAKYLPAEAAACIEEVKPPSLVVPLRSRGGRLGSLVLIMSGSRCPDAALAQELAHHAAMAIDNASLYREAQQAVRARDDFLSIASHELRTPLTPLRLQIGDLLDRARARELQAQPAEKVTARLESVSRQVDRVARLVSNLLDVSRIMAGRVALEREPVELVSLVREVLERADPEVQRGRYQVRLEATPPLIGRWDRLRIEQVVTNLVSNALKYGEGKPIELCVQRKDGEALLQVRDHGIGVAPDQVERIFGRFERAVSARSYGGMGLGLYIVRRFVEAHGGTVRVESRLGEGSTFIVELPLD